MSATEDDDYAKEHSLVYPAMLFEHLRTPDDALLLRPIVMVVYALTMDDDVNGVPLAHIEDLTLLESELQYVLTVNIPDSLPISDRAWQVLMSVSPARLKAVHVLPYYDEALQTARMRIVVDVLSTLAPLSRSFDAYRRKNRSFLVPNSAAPRAAPPAARRDFVPDIRRACREMTRMRDDYVFDQNFHCDLGTMTMQWCLPTEQMFDIDAVFMLLTQFSDAIKEISVGMRVTRDGLPGFRPLMQIAVNITLVGHSAEPAVMIDTQTLFYASDPAAEGAAKLEPWFFDASGPRVQQMAAAITTARGGAPVGARRSARHAGRGRGGAAVTHNMAHLARKPTNYKRKRPAGREPADDDADLSDSSVDAAMALDSEPRAPPAAAGPRPAKRLRTGAAPLPAVTRAAPAPQEVSWTGWASDLASKFLPF